MPKASELWRQYAPIALQMRKARDSFKEIAEAISAASGIHVTRNAVAGRLFRDNAPRVRNNGGRPGVPKPPRKPSAASRLRHIKANAAAVAAPECRGVTLWELNERCDCRFPVSDKPRTLYCGNPKCQGFSYCQFHTAAAYYVGSKPARPTTVRYFNVR